MSSHARTRRPTISEDHRRAQEQPTVGGLLAVVDTLLRQGGVTKPPARPEEVARQVHGVLAQRRGALQKQLGALEDDARRLEEEQRRTTELLAGSRPDARFDAIAMEGRRLRAEDGRRDVQRRLLEARAQLRGLDADARRLAEHPASARAIGLAHGVGPSLPKVFDDWLGAPSNAQRTQTEADREEALRVACAVPLQRLRAELNSTWVHDATVLSILRGLTAEQRRYVDAQFRDEEGNSLKQSIVAGLQGADEGTAVGLLTAQDAPQAKATAQQPDLDAQGVAMRADGVDEATLNEAYRTVNGHFTDAGVLESLQALDPATRDALLLKKASALRSMVDGDELARMEALLQGAKDPGGASVREQRMEQATTEAVDELRKTLVGKGYTDEEIEAQLADPATKDALQGRAQALDQQRVIKLHALAGDLFAGVDGVGDDPAMIYGALRKLPRGEAGYLEDLYRQRYGMDLRTQLKEDLGTDPAWDGSAGDGQVALDLLSKDESARSRGLEGVLRYATRGTDDEKLAFDVLAGLTDEERSHLLGEVGGEARWKTLLADLSPREQAKARALLEVDADARAAGKASAEMALHMYGTSWWDLRGIGTDEDPILDAAQDLTAEQLKLLESTWQKQQGSDLRESVDGELSGDAKKVLVRELDGDKDGADAARLQLAADNWGWGLGTDERLLTRTYKKAHERKAMGSVEGRLKKELGHGSHQLLDEEFGTHSAESPDAERVMMGQYLADGKADDALRLYVAYDGLGTDVAEVKDVAKGVRGQGPAAMADLYDRYDAVARQMGGSAEGLLSAHEQDIGGREGFDLGLQLQGRATDRSDQQRRAQQRLDYETTGWGAIGHGATRGTEWLGMHNKASAFERTTTAVIDGRLDGRQLDRTQIDAFAQGLSQDQRTYGATRDTVGDTIADGAALTAMVLTTVLTEGAAAPVWAALWGGAASSASKLAIKDGSVSNEAALRELASLGLSVGTAGLGNLAAAKGLEATVAQKLIQRSPSMDPARAELLAKMMVAGGTQAPSNLANEALALDPDTMSDGRMAQQLLLGGMRRTLGSSAGAGLGHRIDVANNATSAAKQTFGTGIEKGIGEGVVNAALDPKVHGAVADGKRDQALQHIGYGVAKDAVTTAAGDAAGGHVARGVAGRPAEAERTIDPEGTTYVDPDLVREPGTTYVDPATLRNEGATYVPAPGGLRHHLTHPDGGALLPGARGPDGPESALEYADRGLNDMAWSDVLHHLSLGLPFHMAVFEALEGPS